MALRDKFYEDYRDKTFVLITIDSVGIASYYCKLEPNVIVRGQSDERSDIYGSLTLQDLSLELMELERYILIDGVEFLHRVYIIEEAIRGNNYYYFDDNDNRRINISISGVTKFLAGQDIEVEDGVSVIKKLTNFVNEHDGDTDKLFAMEVGDMMKIVEDDN